MIDVTLHPEPRWRDVVLEQVRIVGLSLRREALIALLVLGIVTVVIGSDIARGGPGFDSNESLPTSIASFLFPFAVWRGARRFGPDFLWILPVDRRRMAFAKVFAGWVWMMAALAVFVVWLIVLAFFAHAAPAQIVMRIPFVATTATYLLGSAFVLGLRHPLRWLLGAAAVVFLTVMLTSAMGEANGAGLLRVSGLLEAASVWRTLPALAQWAITTFLWFGAGMAALWAAVSRHGEHRRH